MKNQPLLSNRNNPPHIIAGTPDRSIGRILMDAGKLKQEGTERIISFQKERGVRFGEAALKLRLLTRQDIQYALSRQFEYPYLERGEGELSKELIAAYEPFGAQAEALRSLRSQLLLHKFCRDYKTQVVISTEKGEGRSYIAANLAVAFSQLGANTLLIDADMRTPRQHHIFNLTNCIGLSAILCGRAGWEVIQSIPAFANLSVMPSGPTPPNPLELLSRGEFSQLLYELSEQYDAVIIDTVAGECSADAQTVAAQSVNARAMALMVIRKGYTRVSDAKKFLKRVKSSGIHVVGSVINQF